ncbi:MAG: hypothetical protein C0412_19970 [Flavobacterium sp.]|nr:hypothetical protein [Flavobacterium sp.]
MKSKYLFSLILAMLFSNNIYSQTDVKKSKEEQPKIDSPNKRTEIISDPKPKPEIIGNILSPENGSSFTGEINLNGTVKYFSVKNHLWLVTKPAESPEFWPHFGEILPEKDGTWNGKVSIGGSDGKLFDVHLMIADNEANKIFNDYLITGKKNDYFTAIPKPDGAYSIAKVKVRKSSSKTTSSVSKDSVNLRYGFTKDGIYYIHKSLIPEANGDNNLFLCYQKNHWDTSASQMKYDGNYYYYQSNINQNSGSLQYCFYCNVIGQWIPDYLLDEKSPLLNKADIVLNGKKDGHNFNTIPQDYFPGIK